VEVISKVSVQRSAVRSIAWLGLFVIMVQDVNPAALEKPGSDRKAADTEGETNP
jgi:hypothetical protein